MVAERVRSRQVPSMWRPVVEEPSTLQLFLNTYTSSQPPLSSQALECLVSPIWGLGVGVRGYGRGVRR